MAQQRLGKGLGALLGDDAAQAAPAKAAETTVPAGSVVELDVNLIDRVQSQPRKTFDEEKLQELAESIKLHGIVQPLIVNRRGDRYAIIAGERRYRAARIAGLNTVPCVVREMTDREHAEIALIENLQREDLNAIEEAEGIRLLMDEYQLTQEEVSSRIAKSRSAVANALRLLTLPSDIRNLVSTDKLSAGHARCLVSLKDDVSRRRLAGEIVSKGMSVRDAEKLVARETAPAAEKPKRKRAVSDEIAYAEKLLSSALETKVSVAGDNKKGRIVIEYYSYEQLDALCTLLSERE